MEKITCEQLLDIMPNCKKNLSLNKYFRGCTLYAFTNALNQYAAEYSINTPLRWAHFIAQVAHESGEFKYTEEIASGANYEGRKDLGNIQTGDGKKFKGRGLIQLTGRNNYQSYKDDTNIDVVNSPELLAMPYNAIASACWFWGKKGLNKLADNDAFKTITKKINGGYNGLKQRQAYLTRAKKILVK